MSFGVNATVGKGSHYLRYQADRNETTHSCHLMSGHVSPFAVFPSKL